MGNAQIENNNDMVLMARIENLITSSVSGSIATGELVSIYTDITVHDEWFIHYQKDRYEAKAWLTNGQIGKAGSTENKLAGVDKLKKYIAVALLTDAGLWQDSFKRAGQYMPLVRQNLGTFANKRNEKVMFSVIAFENMKSMLASEKKKKQVKALTVDPPAGSENSSNTEVIKTENVSEVTENTMLGQLAMMQQDIASHSEKSTKAELLESIAFYQEIVSMLIEKA